MAFGYVLKPTAIARRATRWAVVRSDGRVIFSSLDKHYAQATCDRFNAWARQGWPYQPKVQQ